MGNPQYISDLPDFDDDEDDEQGHVSYADLPELEATTHYEDPQQNDMTVGDVETSPTPDYMKKLIAYGDGLVGNWGGELAGMLSRGGSAEDGTAVGALPTDPEGNAGRIESSVDQATREHPYYNAGGQVTRGVAGAALAGPSILAQAGVGAIDGAAAQYGDTHDAGDAARSGGIGAAVGAGGALLGKGMARVFGKTPAASAVDDGRPVFEPRVDSAGRPDDAYGYVRMKGEGSGPATAEGVRGDRGVLELSDEGGGRFNVQGAEVQTPRQGHGTQLYQGAYDYAAERGGQVYSDSIHSPDAAGWWGKQEAAGKARWHPPERPDWMDDASYQDILARKDGGRYQLTGRPEDAAAHGTIQVGNERAMAPRPYAPERQAEMQGLNTYIGPQPPPPPPAPAPASMPPQPPAPPDMLSQFASAAMRSPKALAMKHGAQALGRVMGPARVPNAGVGAAVTGGAQAIGEGMQELRRDHNGRVAADKSVVNWAIRQTLGDTQTAGLTEQDAQKLMTAVQTKDQAGVASLLYTMQQKNPLFAKKYVQALNRANGDRE